MLQCSGKQCAQQRIWGIQKSNTFWFLILRDISIFASKCHKVLLLYCKNLNTENKSFFKIKKTYIFEIAIINSFYKKLKLLVLFRQVRDNQFQLFVVQIQDSTVSFISNRIILIIEPILRNEYCLEKDFIRIRSRFDLNT